MISQEISHFNIGISQQPATLRSPEQLEKQLNCLSSESNGLLKRPPTLHIGKIDELSNENPLVHTVNRDTKEKYIVICDGANFYVEDIYGVKHQVIVESGQAYVKTDTPRRDLVLITVADYSFVLNRNVKAKMLEETTARKWESQGVLIHVKSGHYGHNYRICQGDTIIGQYTTPDGSESSHTTSITTANIISQLASSVQSTHPERFKILTGEGWLYLERITDTQDFINQIKAFDGYDNSAMVAIHQNVSKFSDLPKTAPDGFITKVQGEIASNADDYYVVYDDSKSLWVETCQPGIEYKIDPATMPHALVSNADGTFTLKQLAWDNREIGDDDSNPLPSFIGIAINDLFFFKNRLGFVAGENVILSESASFFNFWMTTAVNVLDTDPIDVAVSSSSITILNHAVSFNEAVLLISDEMQFLLKSDGILTPKSIMIDPVATYPCAKYVRPVMAGRRMYYTSNRSAYTTVREFYSVGTIDDAKLTTDISSHVPSYIPNGVYQILANTTENLLLFLTEGKKSSVFVYKYLFSEEKRLQASWSEWNFGEEAEILGGGFIDNILYLAINRNGTFYLESMNISVNITDLENEPYRIHLDRKISSVVTEFDKNYGISIIDIKGIYGVENETTMSFGVVFKDGEYIEIPSSELVEGKAQLYGDYRGKEYVLGQLYACEIILSPIYITTDKGKITNGRLQLRYMTIAYAETGSFDVVVNNQFTYKMTGRILTDKRVKLAVVSLSNGDFRFPLHVLNTNCAIKITSNNPTPLNLLNGVWEGDYYARARRI